MPNSQRPSATKMLVIDDDPSMVRLLAKIIGDEFHDAIDIETLIDPQQAKERIQETSFDVLLTDLEMPDINGLELLKFAKSRNAFTQVLFLTGRSTRAALLDAMEFGATDYLLKPVDKEELLGLVAQAHLRRQRWLRALVGTWRNSAENGAAQDEQPTEVGAASS